MNASPAARVVVWILLVLAVLANAAGYFFNLYNRWAWFDEVLHGYTLFAITLPLALLLYGRVLVGKGRHTVVLVAVVTLVGLGLGGLWEIAEWAYDQVATEGSTIKGKYDTIIDLIVDTAGALVAGIIAAATARDRSKVD